MKRIRSIACTLSILIFFTPLTLHAPTAPTYLAAVQEKFKSWWHAIRKPSCPPCPQLDISQSALKETIISPFSRAGETLKESIETKLKNFINYDQLEHLSEEDLVNNMLNDMYSIIKKNLQTPKDALLTFLLIKNSFKEVKVLLSSIAPQGFSFSTPLELIEKSKNLSLKNISPLDVTNALWQNQDSLLLAIVLLHNTHEDIAQFWKHSLALLIKNPKLYISLSALITAFATESINYLTAPVQGDMHSRLTFIASMFPKLLSITGLSPMISAAAASIPGANIVATTAVVAAQLASIAYAYKTTITILFLTRNITGPFFVNYAKKVSDLSADFILRKSLPLENYLNKRYLSQIENLSKISDSSLPTSIADWALAVEKNRLEALLKETIGEEKEGLQTQLNDIEQQLLEVTSKAAQESNPFL